MRFWRRTGKPPATVQTPRDLGFVTIGAAKFPVVSLELRNSSVVMTYAMTGPTAGATGNCTVYGPDGKGCWQGGHKVLPPVPAGEIWHVAYSLTVRQVEA